MLHSRILLFGSSSGGRQQPQQYIPRLSFLSLLLLLTTLHSTVVQVVNAQRFLRQGFSNNEDFGSEMKLDETDSNNAFDMTREMFLMQDLLWQIQPPIVPLQMEKIRSSNNKNDKNQNNIPAIQKHIQHYIGGASKPIDIRLLKKRGKFGLRAVARTSNGKKLRAFWRQSVVLPSPSVSSTTTTSVPQRGIDFLKASYDDACRTRLFTVEFELQLPPIKGTGKNKNSNINSILPSIIYQVSLEPGSMNPKALVPRSAGRVYILPMGRRTGSSNNSNNDRIEVGKAYVSAAAMKPGIVDPSWAKGRPIFRRGRNSGLM